MNKINDSLSRYNIVNTLDKNIFVDASAGAGKTASLTKRMVALVESGIDVSNICTITFTKAAANEFFDRFNDLLYKRTFDNDDNLLGKNDEIKKERCKIALDRINLCFMGTIDSFTNMIVNEYPFKAGIKSNSQVCLKEDRDNKIKEIYYRLLKGDFDNINKNLKTETKEFTNMYFKPSEVFVEGMNLVLDKRHAELIYHQKDMLDKNEFDNIKRFIKMFGLLVRDNPNIKNDNAKYIIKNKYLIENYSSKYFSMFKKYILKLRDLKVYDNELTNISNIDSFEGCFKHTNQSARTPNGYYHFDVYFDDYYKKVCEYQLYKTFSYFKNIKELITNELIKDGLFTFSDYLLILRDLLKDDIENGAKIIKHISNRFSYYLLDESQDTSPIQTEIFYYLSATNYNKDWKKCVPKPGSIFIVGDPKQSIYRFRGADILCYQDTKLLFNDENNLIFELSKNFRSTNAIKNWLNYKMEKYISEDDGNPRFEDIEIENTLKTEKEKDCTLNGVYKYLVVKEDKDFKSDDIKRENSNNIIKIIKQIVNNEKYTILPQKEDIPRTIDYKDIMIITRDKNFNDILVALDENNIPFYAEGRTAFNSCELLVDLKAIYIALLEPYNKEHLFKALNAKVFNLTKNDISSISYDNENFKIVANYINSSKYSDNLNCSLKLLSDLYNKFNMLNSYSSKFETLIYEKEIITSYNITKLDLVYYALELLRNEEAKGTIISTKNCIDFINNINTNNADYERSLKLNKNSNAIKIANVHKVKGLQAPICILSTKGKKTSAPDSILKNGKDTTFEVYSFEKTSGNKDDEEYKEEVKKSNVEVKRIDYVAATRPESVLIIGYIVNNKGNKLSSSWDGLVDDTIPFFPFEEKEYKNKVLSSIDINTLFSTNNSLTANEVSYEKSYEIIRPSTIDKHIISRNEFEEPDSYLIRENKQEVGTIIHRMLEIIVESNNKINKIDLMNQIKNEFDIKDLSIFENVYYNLLNGGYKQKNGINQDLINFVLSLDEKPLCEVPFAIKENNIIYHGIMDLVYKYNDKYYIIDYKTTSESDVEILEERYINQLSIYKKAFKQATGFDAEAHIYHIDV